MSLLTLLVMKRRKLVGWLLECDVISGRDASWWQRALMVMVADPSSHSVTLSWHSANQSLPYPVLMPSAKLGSDTDQWYVIGLIRLGIELAVIRMREPRPTNSATARGELRKRSLISITGLIMEYCVGRLGFNLFSYWCWVLLVVRFTVNKFREWGWLGFNHAFH